MAEQFKKRQVTILIFFGITGLILIGRAFSLQVLDNQFKTKAEAVVMSKQTMYPARGLIYDRNGKLLINNAPVYDLMVVYNQIKPDMDTVKFCELLGIDFSSFKKRLNKDFKNDKRFVKYKPFVFMNKISPETYARFQESLYEFPGFFVQIRNIRNYPVHHAAHVLGYIKEVTGNEIKNSEGQYVLGDYIGASGLERSYEKELRGEKGFEHVLKNNLGQDVEKLKGENYEKKPVSGFDLISTIDIDLQAYVEEIMMNKTGGVVAIEPSTGEILALASSPTYDPGLMVIGKDRGKAYGQLQQDPLKPLFNRALMAEYPPGSIFKPIVGLIGMDMEVIEPYTGMPCPGYYENARNDVRKCRNHPYASNVGIALEWSCNSYFFKTFREIIDKFGYTQPEKGLDKFTEYLDAFGIGRDLGIDFPGEHSGNVPTSNYFSKLYPKEKGSWRSPTIISLGIGQGEMQLTTLQMANVAAIIANNGKYYIPHFAKGFRHEGELLEKPEKYRTIIDTDVDGEYFPIVNQGMRAVVNSGTARGAFIQDIPIAGKTGTVQNPHGEDHSTFIGFAPANNPKIAIAVYVENAGGGGRYAAPIASFIMEKYIRQGEISPARKWQEQRVLETNLIEENP